jgi:hypothetical protein
MDEMLRDLRPIGSTVVTATFPNFSPINPVARLARWRLHYFNSGLRAIAAGRGAPLVEAEDFPTLADRRMWCDDRLHLSPEGHRGLASATARTLGLAHDLALPAVLPTALTRLYRRRLRAELRWTQTFSAAVDKTQAHGSFLGRWQVCQTPTAPAGDTTVGSMTTVAVGVRFAW